MAGDRAGEWRLAACGSGEPLSRAESACLQNASQGPKTAVGWGPAASADRTPKMRFAGERERVCQSNVPRAAPTGWWLATGGAKRIMGENIDVRAH
jgi:hypothetical protein